MSKVNQDPRIQTISVAEGELPSPHRTAAATAIISGDADFARRHRSNPGVAEAIAAIKSRRIE